MNHNAYSLDYKNTLGEIEVVNLLKTISRLELNQFTSKLFINDQLSDKEEAKILKTIHDDSFNNLNELASFFKKSVSGRFCYILNNVEKHNEKIRDFCIKILHDNGKLDLNSKIPVIYDIILFMGDYNYTPSGIHLDNDTIELYQFVLGNENKTMYCWSKEILSKQIEKLDKKFSPIISNDVEKFIPSSFNVVYGGDKILYMMGDLYHLGKNESFSIGFTIAKKSYKRIIDRILTNLKVELNHTLRGFSYDDLELDLKKVDTNVYLKKEIDNYFNRLNSNCNFDGIPDLSTKLIDSIIGVQLKINNYDKLIIQKVADSLVVWVRGYCLEFKYSENLHMFFLEFSKLRNLIDIENTYKIFENSISILEYKYLINQLIKFNYLKYE